MFRFVLGVVCALMLFGCADGRPGSSSNIPIDPIPTCDEQCGDVVCDLVGVEECAPECETCETCEPEIVEVPVCFKVKYELVCRKTFGHDCHWDKRLVEIDCPDLD